MCPGKSGGVLDEVVCANDYELNCLWGDAAAAVRDGGIPSAALKCCNPVIFINNVTLMARSQGGGPNRG